MRSMVERRTFRLGVLVLASVALVVWLAVLGPPDPEIWFWVILGLTAAVGVGLLFHLRVARAVLGLAVAACGALAPFEAIGALLDAVPLAGWTPLVVLGVANAVATTTLGVWLCVRAIQALLGRTWPPSLITARMTGATLAVIAADHLWLAAATGAGPSSVGSSMGVSPSGVQLSGFPGWMIGHLALAVIALAMLAGPRRLVARAATLLVGWCVALVGLVVISGIIGFAAIDAPGRIGAMMTLFAAFQPAMFAYGAWWLRDELRRQAAI